jgi:uncharacterized protein YgiM (DUF1202 family)
MKRIASLLVLIALISLLLPTPTQAQPESQPALNQVAQLTIQATVGVRLLNVRRAPRLSSSVIGRLNKGEVITLIARADGPFWVQANTRFGIGWVDREFLVVGRTADLPITTVVPPFLKAGVHEGLNIRFGPHDDYPISGLLQPGVEADIIAYSPRPLWYKIATAKGVIGWVFSGSAELFGTLDNTPISGELPMIRVMTYNLHVRPAPDLNAQPIGVVRLGSHFYIIGRDWRTNFWLIKGKFGTGWVAAGFTTTIGSLRDVPVIGGGPGSLPVLE